ncbi:hypothetical protein OF897_06195 [Chryseobacterium formosus]|uniref:Uncharacterized protein n=1 Tax=Chryseobacterium formosus TaxID=1537363 RepID=A0ABT3XN14_9FLAO|nr:hypothetical protein [Chryseobacterium formosus]MCX8523507.1 hypothetical protein [Chryseobacterium formosus]
MKEINFGKVSVIYPEEQNGVDRDLILRVDPDETCLHFDFIDKIKPIGGMSLSQNEIKILRDYLTVIINNKIIKEE